MSEDQVPCPISAWECVYHACMSDDCQKRFCMDMIPYSGEGVCAVKENEKTPDSVTKKVLMIIFLMVSVCSCQKDEEPEFTTVRKVYPVEGRYTGYFYMDNDTINLHWKFKNVLVVCAVNGEELLIENCKTTAKAWMGTGEYHYDVFWVHRQTPCGQDFVAEMRGTGVVSDSVIREQGWFRMAFGGEFIRGNWRTEMKKNK